MTEFVNMQRATHTPNFIPLLERFLDILEYVEEERFDMGDWGHLNISSSIDACQPVCKTVHCLAGHAACLPELRKLGITSYWNEADRFIIGPPNGDVVNHFAEVLGLSEDEEEFLDKLFYTNGTKAKVRKIVLAKVAELGYELTWEYEND